MKNVNERIKLYFGKEYGLVDPVGAGRGDHGDGPPAGRPLSRTANRRRDAICQIKEKCSGALWAGVLVLLFLMSSTDLIIKEKKVEIYPISVIIEDANDDYYVNFNKGMDKAAVEFHGDVSFITLYADRMTRSSRWSWSNGRLRTGPRP